jgi:hypothetical protein
MVYWGFLLPATNDLFIMEESLMEFPNQGLIKNPMLELRYEIARPGDIFPWIKQLGYHRGGWYIDTWWDKFEQQHFWSNVVPEEARGTYQPAANQILPEYQDLKAGDIVPDGPPGSAFYEVSRLRKIVFCFYMPPLISIISPPSLSTGPGTPPKAHFVGLLS